MCRCGLRQIFSQSDETPGVRRVTRSKSNSWPPSFIICAALDRIVSWRFDFGFGRLGDIICGLFFLLIPFPLLLDLPLSTEKFSPLLETEPFCKTRFYLPGSAFCQILRRIYDDNDSMTRNVRLLVRSFPEV